MKKKTSTKKQIKKYLKQMEKDASHSEKVLKKLGLTDWL